MQQNQQEEENRQRSPIKSFAIMLLIMEIIIIILFIVFARMNTAKITTGDALWSQRYSAFQDVNVMIVVGFGFLMTFIKRYSWSALAYTFFINAIIVQTYILLKSFWQRVWNGFSQIGVFILIDQVLVTESSYAVASALIAFGALIGRIGPRELLLIGWIQMIGYSLNELVVLQSVNAFDAGGSMTIHAFGAYFGLTVSLVLSHKIAPVSKPESNYVSNIVAMIGTLFLWLFWPSFNFGAFAQNSYQQTQIVANTLLSLTGSCVGTFIFSGLLGHKFEMEDILNVTLAGGVAIGSPCGVLYLPGVALAIGAVAGSISVIGFKFLAPKLSKKIQLHDSCGVHNLHGIPGVLGGISSAIIIACYNLGYDQKVLTNFGPNNVFASHTGTFLNQGGLQIAGTFISVIMGIIFGVIAGYIILFIYKQDPQSFYQDNLYFNLTAQEVRTPTQNFEMQKLMTQQSKSPVKFRTVQINRLQEIPNDILGIEPAD